MTIDIPPSTFPELDKILTHLVEEFSSPPVSQTEPTAVLVAEITYRMIEADFRSLRDSQDRISTDLFRIESKLDKLFEITLIIGELLKK
jgi:hypothetical protein